VKTEIEIDVYADVVPEGISRSLWIGDVDEPDVELVESWEDIVERVIGYYVIPSSNTISPQDLIELDETVAGLELAVAQFRQKMAKMTCKAEDK
jgi:hypothetical protein